MSSSDVLSGEEVQQLLAHVGGEGGQGGQGQGGVQPRSLRRLARATHTYAHFRSIFKWLWDRLAQVVRAEGEKDASAALNLVTTLEFLLGNGSPQCLEEMQRPEPLDLLQRLGREQRQDGAWAKVQAKASTLVAILRVPSRAGDDAMDDLFDLPVAPSSPRPSDVSAHELTLDDDVDDFFSQTAPSASPVHGSQVSLPRWKNVSGVTAAAREFRRHVRSGKHVGPTSGEVPLAAQANLVVLPKEDAFDFMLFCQRNPKPCPLIDVLEPGAKCPPLTCHPDSDVDIRTDVPAYNVYENGDLVREAASHVTDVWRDDLVSFLLGCSFSFEQALVAGGIPMRHEEEGVCVPMYVTSRQCVPAGKFHGPMVVSMRPMTHEQAIKAVQITSRYPRVHGAPVHIGDPAAIGIKDVGKPDFGDPVTVRPGEVPVFWACGVTPQAVAMASRPSFMITHKPGCMFVCDVTNEDLAG